MWYVEKGETIAVPSDVKGTFGRCRKRSPTLDGWPAMFSTDWCGDHKLDETKID